VVRTGDRPRVHHAAPRLGVSPAPFDSFNLGLRAGDDADAVLRNRELLVGHASLPSPPRWLRQVHGVQVQRFDDGAAAVDEPEADAAVTATPGRCWRSSPPTACRCCSLPRTAARSARRTPAGAVLPGRAGEHRGGDADTRRSVAGVAWAGRGTAALRDRRRGVRRLRRARLGAGAAFVTTRPHHWRVDLYALARRRLQALGIDADASTAAACAPSPMRSVSSRTVAISAPAAWPRWCGSSQPMSAPVSIPLYRQLLAAQFDTLPPKVRALHERSGLRRYHGKVEVERGGGWASRLCAWATRLPRAGKGALRVEIDADEGGERWARVIAGKPMRSRLWARDALLREQLGWCGSLSGSRSRTCPAPVAP
jgi:hypothetical protein